MPPPTTTELLDLVLELAVLVDQDMTTALAERGLTPSRAHLLWELAQRGPSPQRVLAEALRVSARNVTGLVDGLEATGFVTRAPHPHDRRATLVTLTSHGQQVVQRMQQEHEQLAVALFDDLTDRRRSDLAVGLRHVVRRFRELVEQGSPA